MVSSHTQDKIKITPNRGKHEPIQWVLKSEVILHSNHIEVIMNYGYISKGKEETTKYATLAPKNMIVLDRIDFDFDDGVVTEDRHIQGCMLYLDGTDTRLLCKDEVEANELYHKIKKWILK